MRLFATRRGRMFGPDEIARRSGLSRSTVQRVSAKRSWAKIDFETADKFAAGCGYNMRCLGPLIAKIRMAEKYGLSHFRHLTPSKHAPLWKRGAIGNSLKCFKRIMSQ